MENLTEDYKKFTQVNEGLGDIFDSIVGFFETGYPKHPDMKREDNLFYECRGTCDELYPATDIRLNVPMGTQKTKDEWGHEETKERELDFKYYKEHPEHAKCLLLCDIDYLKRITKMFSKNPEKMCSWNVRPDKCTSWIRSNVPAMERKLKVLEREAKRLPTGVGKLKFNMYKKIVESKEDVDIIVDKVITEGNSFDFKITK